MDTIKLIVRKIELIRNEYGDVINTVEAFETIELKTDFGAFKYRTRNENIKYEIISAELPFVDLEEELEREG
jgi:hypothetical protein